ncbi:MAG: FAD:protein FMN transferase [Bacteroidales bacterium]
MKRNLYIIITIVFSIILLSSCSETSHYHRYEGFTQGGTFHVIYSDINSNTGNKIQIGLSEIEDTLISITNYIENTFSGYNQASLLSQINHNTTDIPNNIFIELFNISKNLWVETDGLFDISGAPLYDAWGFGFANKIPVDQHIIDSLLCFVGMDKLDIINNKVVKKDPRVELNFNAIAQGYTADLIGKKLEVFGITDYLVDVGMEIYCKGHNSSDKKWQIGIDKPIDGSLEAGKNIQDILEVTNVGIVTSGNYRKFYYKDGKKIVHTINPTTGKPAVSNLLSATVIAKNSTIADAYATYCMTLGLEKAKEFLNSRDDLDGYLIYSEDSRFHVYSTMGNNRQ